MDTACTWNRRRRPDNRSADGAGSHGEAGLPDSAENLHVQVRLFALAKERAGRSVIDLELAPASRVAGLRAALRERFPALAPLLPNVLIAINEEYADDDALIPPGSRIAVIPPVSGGAGECRGLLPESRSRSTRTDGTLAESCTSPNPVCEHQRTGGSCRR